MKKTRYFTQKQLESLEEFVIEHGKAFRKEYGDNVFYAVLDALTKGVASREKR